MAQQFNNPKDIYTKPFQRVDVTDTIGQWVDAFNNNALASSDHAYYLGEMLFNGILYTGKETIGGIPIASLTNLNISPVSAQNLELDNFYLYFRDINKVLLIDQVTFDLRAYNTGHPMFFYINSDLGYRVSQKFEEQANEIMLFRFILSPNEKFKQCYVTAQRFGSNVYDTADEFYYVKGCVPMPVKSQPMKLRLGNGTIKRSGIKFDFHQIPDVLIIQDKEVPFNLRYITVDNKVDYDQALTRDVIANKWLNYSTKVLTTVPADKFTIQRILYDVYADCLIMQYGNGLYNSLEEALSSVNNVGFPFPYNELMYIPMGLIAIKGDCTDLTDSNKCIMIQQLNTTVDATQSVFFAEDSYARGRLTVLKNEIDVLQQQIIDLDNRVTQEVQTLNNRITNEVNTLNTTINTKIKSVNDRIDASNGRISTLETNTANHYANKNNPHGVTKSQVGLSKVDNMSFTDYRDSFDGRYVPINGNSTVNGDKTFSGHVVCSNYIIIQGRKLYVGGTPTDQANGDFWLPDS